MFAAPYSEKVVLCFNCFVLKRTRSYCRISYKAVDLAKVSGTVKIEINCVQIELTTAIRKQ